MSSMMFQEPETIGPMAFIIMERSIVTPFMKVLTERYSNVIHFNHFLSCIRLEGEQVRDWVVILWGFSKTSFLGFLDLQPRFFPPLKMMMSMFPLTTVCSHCMSL